MNSCTNSLFSTLQSQQAFRIFANNSMRLVSTALIYPARTRSRQNVYPNTRDALETKKMESTYTYQMLHLSCLKTFTDRSTHNCAKFYLRSFHSLKTCAFKFSVTTSCTYPYNDTLLHGSRYQRHAIYQFVLYNGQCIKLIKVR